jgi:hypothetical protein
MDDWRDAVWRVSKSVAMSQSKSSSRATTKSPRINPVSVAHSLVVAEHLRALEVRHVRWAFGNLH